MSINILSYNKEQLGKWLSNKSQPGYRLNQILDWVYKHRIENWSQAVNLPGALRDELENDFCLREAKLEDVQQSPDGAAKLLLRWCDGSLTETVLLAGVSGKTRKSSRRSVCISTQVGCPVRCSFCASGKKGLERSLSAAQIVEQLFWVQKQLPRDEHISNVVVMGMGEPLANYNNTMQAVRIINAAWGLGLGARHITISTVGIPDKIRQLAKENLQVTLAVSLHAGDDDLRAKLVPWAKKYNLESIFSAIDYYYQHTHREVTLEYVMLNGINCSQRDADNLAMWARKSRCNVNLINYNPVEQTGFLSLSRQEVEVFMDWLKRKKVNVHLRRSLGGNIDAACGQLRLRKL